MLQTTQPTVPAEVRQIITDPIADDVLDRLQAVVAFAAEEIKRIRIEALGNRISELADLACKAVDSARAAAEQGEPWRIESCAQRTHGYATEMAQCVKQYRKLTGR